MLGSLYLITVASARHYQYSRAYVATQQETMKGMQRLSRDLSNSVKEQVSYSNSMPAYLWFLSPERPAPDPGYAYEATTGRLLWWKWLAYFLVPATGELVRSEVPLTGAPVPVVVPAPGPVPGLALFRAVSFPGRVTVARQIESFSITANSSQTSYRITLVATEAVASDRVTRVSLTSQITMRNK